MDKNVIEKKEYDKQIEVREATENAIALREERIGKFIQARMVEQKDVFKAIYDKDTKIIEVQKKTDKEHLFGEVYIHRGHMISEYQMIDTTKTIDISSVNTVYKINNKSLDSLTASEMHYFTSHNKLEITKSDIRNMYNSDYKSFISYMNFILSGFKKSELNEQLIDISGYTVEIEDNNILVDGIQLKLVDLSVLMNLFKASHPELICEW